MVGILNIQMTSVVGNKQLNIKKVEHFINKHSDKKLDLVVLPEFFSTGIDHNAFLDNPEDENGGETISAICDIAKKFNTNIAAGTVIEKSGENLYNTSFVINREGKIIDKYRKIHLFNYMGGTEGERITAGNETKVIDLDFGKIGMSICYDMRYPLHYKKLAQRGADIIVSPTAWCIPNEIYNDLDALHYAQEMWIAMNRVRAYDNQIYLISCNQTRAVNKEVQGIGNSMVISPTAEILSNAQNEQGAVYTEIDIQLAKYYRSICPIAQFD